VRVQVLQHVPFEGIGSIQPWMDLNRALVSTTRLFAGETLPLPDDFDWLVVMGGPMSVNDEKAHAWLRPEKRLIAGAVKSGKTVLGICLGAQLIASALGARVYPNASKEIGWFPVRRTGPVTVEIAHLFPDDIEVFHWHGETFDLPKGATMFLESQACANQAFAVGRKVIGLQFHLETTPQSALAMIENSRDEIVPGPTIQTEQEMMAAPGRFAAINRLMDSVLHCLAQS
jgi:GMP synthase-like glutamine amidotransferase